MELLDLAARIDTFWTLIACLLAINLWSVALIARSTASLRDKLLWSAVVFLCPVVGCVYWYVFGPKPDLSPPAGEGKGA